MKYLGQFQSFNSDLFFKDKTLLVTGVSQWQDFNTGEHKGTKVNVVIAKDNTVYKQSDGEKSTNRFEKLSIKVPKDIDIPLNCFIKMTGTVDCKIYGQYRNQLSVTADDIKVIQKGD